MEHSLAKVFGNRVRQLRKAQRRTLEQLAEHIGMDPKYLGAIERGERNITLAVVEKIARGFKTEPYHLFLFSLSRQEKDEGSLVQEKFTDLFKHCDEKSKELILKISQDILGWQERKK